MRVCIDRYSLSLNHSNENDIQLPVGSKILHFELDADGVPRVYVQIPIESQDFIRRSFRLFASYREFESDHWDYVGSVRHINDHAYHLYVSKEPGPEAAVADGLSR